jgi:hypothetical protein
MGLIGYVSNYGTHYEVITQNVICNYYVSIGCGRCGWCGLYIHISLQVSTTTPDFNTTESLHREDEKVE